MIKNDFKTIDEYITVQPKEIAILLENVRATIKKAAPEATEAISYAIPPLNFMVIWFILQILKITLAFILVLLV